MLSPAKYHTRLPKELSANLLYRQKILTECRESVKYRDAVKSMCRDDLIWYVNTFCYTYAPKASGQRPKVIPFITWGGQDAGFQALVDHIDRQRPLAVEKSRDMGWSWQCVYTADWLWRFHPWTKTGLFSRIADLVDSKDPDSLFWKVRFVQKWLPRWLWPEGWTPRLHDTSMYRENPETNSVITGQATTQDMGVAGRCTWAVFDEFSRVPNAFSVRDNTKDTADCRVFVSTHTGPGTCFHNICTNGITDKIITHWTEHPTKSLGLYEYDPEYNRVIIHDKRYQFPSDYQFIMDGNPTGGPRPCVRSPWYDAECKERSRSDVKTNIDIDVQGSTSQFFQGTVINTLIRETARAPVWEGDIHIDLERGVSLGLSKLDVGPLRLWIRPTRDECFLPARYVMGADISAGTGATPSCLTVADQSLGRKVLEYTTAALSPEKFAAVCVAIGHLFRSKEGQEPKFVWEMAGAVGQAFGKRVMALGYAHVYYRELPMSYAGIRKSTDSPGWYPHGENKKNLLLDYAAALEHRRFENPSQEALKECLLFRWTPAGGVAHAAETVEASRDDPSGAGLNHSDHVIADGLCSMLCERPGGFQPKAEYERDPEPGSWQWRRQQEDVVVMDDWAT